MNIEKFTWLARGDQEFLSELINRTVKDIKQFNVGYTTHIINNDMTRLKSVVHEIKSLIERLEIKDLLELIEAGKSLLREQEKDQTKIEENAKAVDALTKKIVAQLDTLIEPNE